MSTTNGPKEVEHSLKQNKYYRLKRIEDLDAKDYEKSFSGKSFEERSIRMFQIVKSLGKPIELLGNNLDLLRKTGLDEETLDIIAIYLLYTKVYTNQEERQSWRNLTKTYQGFIKSPYAQKRPMLIRDLEAEIANLQNRFCLDFLSETIGILMEIIPLDSKRKRSIIISEQLRELDIQIHSPFYTLEEANDEAERSDTFQDGISIIYDRLKKYDIKYKKMIENTIALIKQNNL
ncbi:hypothetical protein C8N47_105155 [Mangrovibacterium marinum]|uniref:Uncharacterized protein n=1 Tax=Mangrovibacterium marinum TaxID=1639118 RepID=A0A2T5C3I4_9BACT|nr:hypothetical protein [Mangrovibacterium marinum]PTN09314.1 hypothetical protein C8N47_105155 [Mangrovibacterium marinum]